MRLLKVWAAGWILSLGAVAVFAGPVEDGLKAYERGDFAAAAKLFRKAAEQGNARAQLSLGILYEQGQGVPKDDQQAVAWYRKPAERGNAMAQKNLGLMCAHGRGVASGLKINAHI